MFIHLKENTKFRYQVTFQNQIEYNALRLSGEGFIKIFFVVFWVFILIMILSPAFLRKGEQVDILCANMRYFRLSHISASHAYGNKCRAKNKCKSAS